MNSNDFSNLRIRNLAGWKWIGSLIICYCLVSCSNKENETPAGRSSDQFRTRPAPPNQTPQESGASCPPNTYFLDFYKNQSVCVSKLKTVPSCSEIEFRGYCLSNNPSFGYLGRRIVSSGFTCPEGLKKIGVYERSEQNLENPPNKNQKKLERISVCLVPDRTKHCGRTFSNQLDSLFRWGEYCLEKKTNSYHAYSFQPADLIPAQRDRLKDLLSEDILKGFDPRTNLDRNEKDLQVHTRTVPADQSCDFKAIKFYSDHFGQTEIFNNIGCWYSPVKQCITLGPSASLTTEFLKTEKQTTISTIQAYAHPGIGHRAIISINKGQVNSGVFEVCDSMKSPNLIASSQEFFDIQVPFVDPDKFPFEDRERSDREPTVQVKSRLPGAIALYSKPNHTKSDQTRPDHTKTDQSMAHAVLFPYSPILLEPQQKSKQKNCPFPNKFLFKLGHSIVCESSPLISGKIKLKKCQERIQKVSGDSLKKKLDLENSIPSKMGKRLSFRYKNWCLTTKDFKLKKETRVFFDAKKIKTSSL